MTNWSASVASVGMRDRSSCSRQWYPKLSVHCGMWSHPSIRPPWMAVIIVLTEWATEGTRSPPGFRGMVPPLESLPSSVPSQRLPSSTHSFPSK